ncbi:Cyclic pyranopterin monophosphate synthase [compost metagenome]
MLSFALANGFELRLIELMRMGHLAGGDGTFQRQFVGMPELLELIGTRYAYTWIEAPKDSTSVRYRIGTSGTFGVIPNESAPFCRDCSRLRLSAQGWLHGCLSSARRYHLKEVLALAPSEAIAQLRPLLWSALQDKQEVSFTGSPLIMKSVGG